MSSIPTDRRRTPERRQRTLWAVLYGSFNPRRRSARRAGGLRLGGVDWHEPRWLAVAILIILFSTTDAFLTLRLIDHGAYEVNPIMRHLVGSSASLFAVTKIGLTIVGVVLLT